MQAESVKKLYYQRLSGSEISKKLGLHIRQVYRILDRLGIPRRSPAEQNRIRFLKSPLSYNFKKNLSKDERGLYIAALMLYYGEGAKTGQTVDLANSDPGTLKIFLKFLREICRVDEKKLRFYLYHFSDQDQGRLISFWCNELKIKRGSFTKPYVRENGEKLLRKMPYGVLHIRYSDSRLLNKILELNKELTIKLTGGVVEWSITTDCKKLQLSAER